MTKPDREQLEKLDVTIGKNEGMARVCQRCGSRHVKAATTPWKSGAAAFAQYKCQRCGFEGMPVDAEPGMEKELEKRWVKGGRVRSE